MWPWHPRGTPSSLKSRGAPSSTSWAPHLTHMAFFTIWFWVCALKCKYPGSNLGPLECCFDLCGSSVLRRVMTSDFVITQVCPEPNFKVKRIGFACVNIWMNSFDICKMCCRRSNPCNIIEFECWRFCLILDAFHDLCGNGSKGIKSKESVNQRQKENVSIHRKTLCIHAPNYPCRIPFSCFPFW